MANQNNLNNKEPNHVDSDKPLVSLVIPIYNVENYLASCLESVVNQTYQHIEVILIDDGSTDKSNDIAAEFATNHSWKLIHQENRGLSEARHTGFLHATGEYLMFLDSDDMLVPEAIEFSLSELQKHAVDVAVFRLLKFSSAEDLQNLFLSSAHTTEVRAIRINDPLHYHLAPQEKPFHIYSMTACGKLYKRHLLETVDWDLINFRANEDEAFICYPYLEATNGIVVLDAELYLYRQSPESITRSTYQNLYKGVALSRLEFFNVLQEVQEAILGPTYSPLVLNYYIKNVVCRYIDDLTAINQHVHALEYSDTQRFIEILDKNSAQYLQLPSSITNTRIRSYVEAYAANGYTGFIQMLLIHQYEEKQRELQGRDLTIDYLNSVIHDYDSSRSWKLTAPLRKVQQLIRSRFTK